MAGNPQFHMMQQQQQFPMMQQGGMADDATGWNSNGTARPESNDAAAATATTGNDDAGWTDVSRTTEPGTLK